MRSDAPTQRLSPQLDRHLIRAHVGRWPGCTADIASEHTAGVWSFVVEPEDAPFRPGRSLGSPHVVGTAWLVEVREGHPAVEWELGDQTNRDAAPVLLWDRAHPAGPWP